MMARWMVDDVEIIKAEVEKNSSRLFQKISNSFELAVSRLSRLGDDTGKIGEGVIRDEKIDNLGQISALKPSNNCCQIFIVRHNHCWDRLKITHELFQGILNEYSIFLPFWKCVFPFGQRVEENEFQFPAFRARRHIQPQIYRGMIYSTLMQLILMLNSFQNSLMYCAKLS